VEELSAVERLRVHPLENSALLALPVHLVRLETLHQVLALEKTPYVIAPFIE
jgi:hypothetical protein